MKKSRKALLTSALSMLLCFSMLLGTTYAWFTDSVESTNNIIQAGNLDVELEYWDKDAKKWESVGGGTPLFEENTLWEPGYTQVVYLRAANKGTLALKYQLGINIAEEKSGTRVDENGQEVSFKLSDSIYMGVKEGVNGETGAYATREAAVDAVKDVEGKSGIISKGFNKYGDMNANDLEYLAVVVYMPESVGNEANHKTGTEAPKITLGIKLLATQKTNEEDSFGSDYDAAAKHPYGDVNYTAAKEIPDDKIDTDSNNVRTLNDAVTIGSESDGIYAEAPDGVQLADGATALELTVQAMDESNANITTNKGETAASLDVHVEGVHEDNDKPIVINLGKILPVGLNSTSVALYHVENGVPVPMTKVANPVNHNEFSYDPATGEVVVAMAKFSEVAVVSDVINAWEGNFDYSWYVGKSSPYTISSADQFAGFGAIVDGTAEGIDADNFEGDTVLLGADIDLGGMISFDPIGFGYDYAKYNSGGAAGKTFNGTFDGQGFAIRNLYVNGWDIGISYSNSGGGLFASVCNATIRNLSMVNANIVMECVEQGVIAGLAQGNCTFDNITISNCSVANYQRATGGVVGEVSPKYDANGTPTASVHKFHNILIDANTVVGSLWGDFDAPVGGVIGGYWDDAGVTEVEMFNVTVACRLDVYNDVTSSYQWYAYRRAGMLIGNSDRADGHTATASFLKCKKNEDGTDSVKVYYGPWVNYHYCEFSEEYNSPKWPWVRVEKGENCSAYSNPRWGVATDESGNAMTDAHTEDDHSGDDEHYVELKFKQLYGGGQGVYGQATHDGVTVAEYDYTVSYVNNYVTLKEDYVASGASYTVNFETTINGEEITKWEDAGAHEYANGTSITVNDNVVLYPVFADVFEIRFMGADNYCYYYETFKENSGTIYLSTAGQAIIKKTLDDTIASMSESERENYSASWVEANQGTHFTYGDSSTINTNGVTADIVVHLTFTYIGSVQLNPVDSDSDGDIDYYEVVGVSENEPNVVIPAYVNGIPVTTIKDGVFDNYNDLCAVRIPATVETLGSSVFPGSTSRRQTTTIYYEGTKDQLRAYMDYVYSRRDSNSQTRYTNVNGSIDTEKMQAGFADDWDAGLGDGTRIFFLKDGKVDLSQGYWELWARNLYLYKDQHTWYYHNHSYVQGGDHSGCTTASVSGAQTDYINDTVSIDGATVARPDKEYWLDDNGNSIYNIQG